MNKKINDLDNLDLPDMPNDPWPEIREEPKLIVQAEDLHLGPATVRPLNDKWWIKEYGPKPPGPGIVALDLIIIGMVLIMLDILVLAWIHVFS